MASGHGNPGTDSTAQPDSFDADAYLDAANRLERAMDTQIQILEGIDDKAEHVTRLVALLIGIVFSVISFVTQLGRTPFSPLRSSSSVKTGRSLNRIYSGSD